MFKRRRARDDECLSKTQLCVHFCRMESRSKYLKRELLPLFRFPTTVCTTYPPCEGVSKTLAKVFFFQFER